MTLETLSGYKKRLTECPFCGLDFEDSDERPADHIADCVEPEEVFESRE